MAEESTARIKILMAPAGPEVSQADSGAATRKTLDSLQGLWNYHCEGEDAKKRAYNVIFPQSAYRQVVDHLSADKTREHGGFLLGYETQIGPAKTPTIVIEEAVPAKFTNGTPVRLTFTTDSWRSLDEHTDRLREQGRVLQRVGWYHSHPNISIFLSHWDLDVCKTFDQRRYPVALVVDPVNDRGGFFVATNKIYPAHSPQGFYESPDLLADPIVTWQNMTRQDQAVKPSGEGNKPQTKLHVVGTSGTTDQAAPTADVQPAPSRLSIVVSVLALLFSLGGFGILYDKQRDLTARMEGNQQDLSSLKATVDATADNVTDLRASLEKPDKPKDATAQPVSVSVSVTPAKVTLQRSEKTVFHANVSGASAPGVRWTITPSHGVIKANGEYKAPASISKEEDVTVKATSVADASKFSTAVVTLKPALTSTLKPPPTGNSQVPAQEVSVRVAPDHASLTVGGKQTFTATVTGASETSVSWSVEGDGHTPGLDGDIQDGVYAAPPAVTQARTVKVKAVSNKDPTKFGTATVDLSPAPVAPATPH